MTDYDKDILFEPDPDKDKSAFDAALKPHFEQKGNFNGVHFPDDLHVRQDFGAIGIPPDKRLSFENAVFHGKACFNGFALSGLANFSRAHFKKTAAFDGCEFEEAYFNDTIFCECASFDEALFRRKAHFTGTRFHGEANFAGSRFLSSVALKDTHFFEKAIFRDTQFGGFSSIVESRFAKEADFQRAGFEEHSTFSNSCFTSKVSFYRADFQKKAFFSNTSFFNRENQSVFKETDFFDGVSFKQSDFRSQKVTFFNAEIAGTSSFAGKPDSKIFAKAGDVDFRGIALSSIDKLSFVHVDLSRTTLLSTDMSSAELTGIRWAETKDGEAATYDEVRAESNSPDESSDWEQIEKLNRDLRLSFERNRDFARAGRFHIREKEIQRTRTRAHEGYRTFLELYYRLSRYGENPWLPLVWLCGIFVGSALAYYFLGLAIPESAGCAPSCDAKLGDSFLFSLSTTLLRPSSLEPSTTVSWVVHYFQIFISPILIGITGLAIRQRVKR